MRDAEDLAYGEIAVAVERGIESIELRKRDAEFRVDQITIVPADDGVVLGTCSCRR